MIATTQVPHDKSTGQLSSSSADNTKAPSSKADLVSASEKAAHDAHNAEKIRYGQSISEGGMGGKTTGLTTSTEAENVDPGADEGQGGSLGPQGSRVAGGYGGERDMDREIGA